MDSQRRYWIISPNVKNDEKTIEAWKKQILRTSKAIMGWAPDDYDHGHQWGPKFAGKTNRSIQHGDIVLIARRYQSNLDMVAFGLVKGACRKAYFRQFDEYAYQRRLEPFKPWSRVPQGIQRIGFLPPINRAGMQLHPEKNQAHRKICKWIEEQLDLEDQKGESVTTTAEGIRKSKTFGYQVRKPEQVIEAKKREANLLKDYEQWLKKKGRHLSTLRYGRIECDAWEEERQNLLEAKGSTRREDIRMAVGQLFDYSFQGRNKYKQPNMAILLPNKPVLKHIEWLESLGIKIIWRRGRSFLDNANGQFV